MDWEEYNKGVQKERQRRRDEATNEIDNIQRRLADFSIVLRQCTTAHYQLIYGDWIYNLYPGNQRIYSDPKHRGPFLNVPKPWTLSEVADAVIAHAQKIIEEIRTKTRAKNE